jgi:hypothetical protein
MSTFSRWLGGLTAYLERQVVVDRMAKARDAATAVNANYWKVQTDAVQRYNQVKELYLDQTFWQWAAANYPPLAAAGRMRCGGAAQTEAMQHYFGRYCWILKLEFASDMSKEGDQIYEEVKATGGRMRFTRIARIVSRESASLKITKLLLER